MPEICLKLKPNYLLLSQTTSGHNQIYYYSMPCICLWLWHSTTMKAIYLAVHRLYTSKLSVLKILPTCFEINILVGLMNCRCFLQKEMPSTGP